jgi:hypothetical protein
VYDNDSKIEALSKQLDGMKQENEQRALQVDLKVDSKQAAALVPLVRGGLTPHEALTVAKNRDPALFDATADDKRGFQGNIHGGLRPKGSGPAPVETLKQKVNAIKEVVNPIDRDAAERRLHGKMVLDLFAQSMGLKSRE